jgi:uncharacterized phage protein (TIGR02218 family)
MKTVSANMITALATRRTTLAWSIVFTRPDGVVLRYCGGTRDKTIASNLYSAQPGFTLSSITATAGASVVDTLELTVLPSNDVEKADFLAGRWNGTRCDIAEFDWATPANGTIPWPSYRVADIRPQGAAFVLELRDLRVMWAQDYTLHTGKECQNRLGDTRCAKVLTAFTHTFTVTSVTNRRVFTCSGLAQAADYFTAGQCTFDDGLHADLPLLVLDHATGGVITLAVPLMADVVIGQTGVLIAGCMKRLADCRDKFSNVLNMRAPGLHGRTLEQMVA